MFGKSVLQDGYIFVAYEPVSDGSDLLVRAKEVGKLMADGAPRRVILDARHIIWSDQTDMSGPLSADILKIVPHDIKLAVLTADGAESPPRRSLVARMRDAGFNIAHFRSRKAATDWLLDDGADRDTSPAG
jgi:hypothetical protein